MLYEDPAISMGGGIEGLTKGQLYENLVEVHLEGKPRPWVAKSWEIPEPDKFIFKLEPGIKFHDGVAFNASVAKFNYERVIDPKTKSDRMDILNQEVKAVEAVDDYTVAYRLRAPSASFLMAIAGETLMSFVSPKAVEKYNNDLRRSGVGTGPFQHEDFRIDARVSMVRFPDYWQKGYPYLDKIVIQIVPDKMVQKTMLQTGEVDFIANVDQDVLDDLRRTENIIVEGGPVPVLRGIVLNMKKDPFKNKALRQAVAYAIDRKAIQQSLFKDWPLAESFFSSNPTYWFYNPNIKGYPYDPQMARAKLAEGGYPDGFECEGLTTKAIPGLDNIAEAVQAQVAKVGIKIKLKNVENAVHSQAGVSGDYQLRFFRTTTGLDPHRTVVSNLISYAPRVKSVADPYPELDAMMLKGNTTYDMEERGHLYNELDRRMLEEAYLNIPILHGTNFVAYNKPVKGFKLSRTDTSWYLHWVWKQK